MTASHDHRPRSAIIEARKRANKCLASTLPEEHFACSGIRARMKRSDCGQRWRTFNVRAPRAVDRSPDSGQAAVVGSKCSGCPIGAAHAAGRLPPIPLYAPTVERPTLAAATPHASRSVQIGAGA